MTLRADPAAFRARTLARLRGEVPTAPSHSPDTALGRKRGRNTVRNAQRRRELTPWQWRRTLAHFAGLCAYCGEAGKKLEREHFVPLLLGGTLAVGNVVPSCLGCNRRKRDTAPDVWLADRPELYAELVTFLKGAR